jgi:hypothetical protein
MEGPVAIDVVRPRFSDMLGREASVATEASGIFTAMDGTDPATWEVALDALSAAPENHTVLYEDDIIRVLSVSLAPGVIEKPHPRILMKIIADAWCAALKDHRCQFNPTRTI